MTGKDFKPNPSLCQVINCIDQVPEITPKSIKLPNYHNVFLIRVPPHPHGVDTLLICNSTYRKKKLKEILGTMISYNKMEIKIEEDIHLVDQRIAALAPKKLLPEDSAAMPLTSK